MLRGARALPSDHRPPAAARPRHARPTQLPYEYVSAPGERRGAVVELGERGAWKGAPPGDGLRSPRESKGHPEGLPTFSEAFTFRFFSCPLFGFSIV